MWLLVGPADIKTKMTTPESMTVGCASTAPALYVFTDGLISWEVRQSPPKCLSDELLPMFPSSKVLLNGIIVIALESVSV